MPSTNKKIPEPVQEVVAFSIWTIREGFKNRFIILAKFWEIIDFSNVSIYLSIYLFVYFFFFGGGHLEKGSGVITWPKKPIMALISE